MSKFEHLSNAEDYFQATALSLRRRMNYYCGDRGGCPRKSARRNHRANLNPRIKIHTTCKILERVAEIVSDPACKRMHRPFDERE